jgi:hypothetical protein
MTVPVVLLVTGSRIWNSVASIDTVLAMYCRHAFDLGTSLVVMHGDCPRGADAIARAWVTQHKRRGWPVIHDPHPAPWEAECRAECHHGPRRVRKADGKDICQAAGTYRNIAMCELRPHYVEAFIRDASHGATQCAGYAETLGLPLFRTRWENRHRQRSVLARAAGA